MEESKHTSAELRTYLRQRRSGRAKEKIPEFEDFLKDVSVLFALRLGAEEFWSGSPRGSDFGFTEHRYQANTSRQAVPLEWAEVKSIILPEKDRPRSTLITFVSTHCIEEVRYISSGLRRVLSRKRVSTPVGKVQQLDTYCMRWLMRQPGRDFAEKGGVRQRVMAVVRREQYDTLENRVFKDFLIRAENLADSYLEEIHERFSAHKVYQAVKRFRTACQAALELPEMDLISGLSVMPQPNYVLQQDNRYSKIWDAYCKIVRLSNLAEKLWGHKKILKQKLQALGDESVWQVEHEGLARFHSQVWVQPLDGKSEFTEYVCSHHALADENAMARRRMLTRISPVSEGIGVVDLSGGHSWGSSLCIGGFHDNARPRIHQDDYPLLDDEKGAHKIVGLTPECEPTRIPLASIFPVINDVAVQDEKGERLADAVSYANAYCARLFGEYRNCDRTLNELVVLSPDDWNAVTQEFVIRSFHMLERRRVHLLWRSVATAIGLDEYVQPHVSENDIVAVLDVRNDGKVLVTGLKYLKDAESGRLVPQRSVYLRNGRINEGRYGLLPCSDWERVLLYPIVRDAKVICVSGQIPVSLRRFLRVSCRFEPFVSSDSINIGRASYGASRWTVISDGDFGWSQRDGAVSFCRQHDKRTLYFDELEPMWVVGQDEIHEKVVCEALVAAEERFPGGTSRRIPIDCGRLNIGEGQRGVKFLFHIGAITNTTALHEYKQDLMGDFVQQRQPLDVEVEVSPGQGMAITTVMAPIFKQPIVLDYLNNMVLSQETIAKMDDKLERSFPPTSAVVEAIQESVIDSFWGSSETDVERQIKAFIAGRMKFSQIPSEPCLFYRARRKREADLRFGESKLHLLDRYNIFGNVPGALRPKWMSEDDENTLFAKVVAGLRDDCPKALRLIAWTYRGGYKDFEGITRKVFARWKRRESPGYAGGMVVWRSLMANLLPCKELRDLLPLFVEEFTKRGIRGEWNCDDLRLFYNLLQFDEDFSVHACLTCDEASSIALALTKCLTSYRESRSTNSYDAALRSMLYLFRLREKERHFLRDYSSYAGKVPVKDSTRQRMERTFERLNVELDRHMSDERPATTLLRKITKKFLNGSGTLPDVLSILGDK